MVAITLMGREFDVAPLKLGALRQAAPHIDAINEAVGSLDTVEGMADSAGHMLAILSIGLVKLDATLTPARLEDEIGFEDIDGLFAAMRTLLEASGLSPKGEAKAPTAPADPAGA